MCISATRSENEIRVHVTDEILLSVGEGARRVPQLVRAGRISPEAAEAIQRLDALCETSPEDRSVEDPATLETDAYWAEVRELAARALALLDEPPGPPEFSGTVWVQGH